MMDYSYHYKESLRATENIEGEWDVFVSAYNPSDRVTSVFGRATSSKNAEKIWVIHNEYDFSKSELPKNGFLFEYSGEDESGFCVKLLQQLGIEKGWPGRICIDVTGFLRPHMMCLVAKLEELGVRCIDVLYAEPTSYRKREVTEFSKGKISSIRQVAGLEGLANVESDGDLLVIGAGYDDRLITAVSHHKEAAQKVVVLGFPPLRADMYQQNLQRVHRASGALGPLTSSTRFFAPANDPFVTAGVLNDVVQNWEREVSNLYLCPLATKPQALGFVLFFVTQGRQRSCSVIFPFSEGYQKKTSEGIGRTWHYVLEFGVQEDNQS